MAKNKRVEVRLDDQHHSHLLAMAKHYRMTMTEAIEALIRMSVPTEVFNVRSWESGAAIGSASGSRMEWWCMGSCGHGAANYCPRKSPLQEGWFPLFTDRSISGFFSEGFSRINSALKNGAEDAVIGKTSRPEPSYSSKTISIFFVCFLKSQRCVNAPR